MGETGEGGLEVQTSNYKIIGHGDVMCSVVTVINNTIVPTLKLPIE